MYNQSNLKMDRASTQSRVEFESTRPVQQISSSNSNRSTNNNSNNFSNNNSNNMRSETESVDSGFLSEFDEETIRWGVLITRIVSIILFCCVLTAVFLGETTDQRIFILAAMFAVVLAMVFMCSFIDMSICRSSASWHGKQEQ